ncbi:MAG: MaoC/PaaZ C-terminal domain-containing protein [Rhodopila sp.]|nr:MaoC/PaaZ C-terminal domain-containing protein [Rhodopila sp.]
MAIDYDRLMARAFAPIEHRYTAQDAIVYALGVGLGSDPLDRGQLGFVYEEGLKALPTLSAVLGYPGFWAREPDTGIDWRRLVHAEQAFTFHRPLRPAGRIVSTNRVSAIYDKGKEKGALLCQERVVADAESGEKLATIVQTSMLRGDGGFGGPGGAAPRPHAIPDRPADAVCELPTLPQAALIYRLNGDKNPLHVDPGVAQAARFPRPILHGMCTMGVACHAVLRALLAYDPAPMRSMRVRFTAPVFPGETIRTELWIDADVVSFRSTAVERGVVVLNAGRVDLAPATTLTVRT